MTIREAAAHASPGAVIRALFARLCPEAQQALVDSLQAEINASRVAEAKATAPHYARLQ